MLKFFENEKVTLKISKNQIELLSSFGKNITIKREFISLGEDLEKIKKRLKSKEIDIILDEEFFLQKVFLEKEDASELNIKRYVEQEILKNFSEEKDFYFFCYFFDKERNCEIFIVEEFIISGLIEFVLKNNLKIMEIYISNKDNILKDFKMLLSKNKNNIFSRKIKISIFLLLIIFISSYFYITGLKNKINILKSNYYLNEKKLNLNKTKLEEIKKEIEILKIKNNSKEINYSKFTKKIFWIVNIIPESCEISYFYFEKNNLILKGNGNKLEEIFQFVKKLEKDKRIEEINFDYILRKEGFFEFSLEVKLENGRT